MKKKVTIKDVSKEVGLSPSTVSLVMNGKGNSIPLETREKIIACAQRLNYHPDLIAQSLASQKTHTIGLLIPDITNNFFTEYVHSVQLKLNSYGYDIFLCNSEEKIENDLKYINLLKNRRVDGLVLSMSAESLQTDKINKTKELLKSLDIPYIMIDRYIDSNSPYVGIDNETSGYNIAQYLINNGHRKIGVITGPMCLSSSSNRLKGFTKCLRDNNINLPDENIKYMRYDMESGYLGAKELLKNDITAIFTFNDLQAYGVISYAKEKGIKIPDDLSVAGFDDLLYSSILDTKLTTVKQPIEEIANQACDMMMRLINDDEGEKLIRLKTELIIRNSVKEVA